MNQDIHNWIAMALTLLTVMFIVNDKQMFYKVYWIQITMFIIFFSIWFYRII
jgi:hypothetical protein